MADETILIIIKGFIYNPRSLCTLMCLGNHSNEHYKIEIINVKLNN